MKFNIQQDIEAPIDFVFAQMTDFKSMERSAMRRGAEVQRVDAINGVGPGMAWDASFMLRGKQREVQIEISEFVAPDRLVVASRSPSMGGSMVVELMALSRNRTRVNSNVQLNPKNLTAKLLVQSMKLARKNLNKRLSDRMETYAVEVESRFRKSA
jgi:uncharacterized protein YndB with AHSA1/START domain